MEAVTTISTFEERQEPLQNSGKLAGRKVVNWGKERVLKMYRGARAQLPYTLALSLANVLLWRYFSRGDENFSDNMAETMNKNVYVQEIRNDLFSSIIWTPVLEELIFRGAIQDLLFKQVLKLPFRCCLKDKAKVFDSKTAKASRIIATAPLFGYIHMFNPHEAAFEQVQNTTLLGVHFGWIKEGENGLWGSIGAHILNNIFTITTPILMQKWL